MEDFRELNVGDVCFVRAQVRVVKSEAMHFDTIDENGKLLLDWSFSLCDSEYNSILTADDLQQEVKPKYDPCRKFRKGDVVRVVEWNGRKPEAEDKLYTVQQNERPGRTMVDIGPNDAGGSSFYTACFLELVTPVEERGLYVVRHNEAHAAWSIYGPFNLSAVNYFYGEHYPYTEESAKAAAEAECERLNEEYRKEQNNG
jgi:hypothetical protein